jgi:predicted dehydrogenase
MVKGRDFMTKKRNVTRRSFLKKAAAASAAAISFPYIVPSTVLGKAAPSNKIVMGCIGVGWQGGSNMNEFLQHSDARIVAVCDVDTEHLYGARDTVNNRYGDKDCATYADFNELLARDDIEAVSLGLPDHWHAIPAIAAAKAGKDIYAEKPLSHTLAEGIVMHRTVKKYGRIWQTGSWQRSQPNFRFACELVLNGRIGKIHRVEVGLPSGHYDFAGTAGRETPETPPKCLDYDRWLGPAPYAPYCPARVHKNWRWHLDYGGGQLMDWIGHHGDIAHWGMGCDYGGPLEVEGYGEYPRDGLWNSPTKYRLRAKYPNDITMIIAGGYPDIWGGTKWIGPEGWVWVDREAIRAEPESLLRENIGPTEINLYRSPGHQREFLDCVRTRATTLTPCEVAHRSATPGHLGLVAMVLGRKIKWDSKNERVIGDPEAQKMLDVPSRSPWHL